MKWFLFFLSLGLLSQTAFPVINMSTKHDSYVRGELVARFARDISYKDEELMMKMGISIKDQTPDGQIFLLNIGSKNLLRAIRELAVTGRFLYIYPNYIYHIYEDTIVEAPNDPLWKDLWAFENTGQTFKIKEKETGVVKEFVGTPGADIKLREAWSYSRGSRNIIVAIVDTGVYYKHEDLFANIWKNEDEIEGNGVDDDKNGFIDDVRGWNFGNSSSLPFPMPGEEEDPGNNDPNDGHIHGTHVAGTIGAMGNNSIGVVGINWNVSIMPLRFLGEQGQGSLFGAVNAIKYAVANGARIINASWGANQTAKPLEDAINEATSKGVLFVAAAGNGGPDGISDDNDKTKNYPSNYTADGVLAVAATLNNDELTWFSNYGSRSVDVAAPGFAIYSTTPKHPEFDNKDYLGLSGTSMATPVVAGIAALLLSYKPELSNIQLKSVIMASSESNSKIGGKTVTGGRVDAARAIKMLANNELYIAPNSTELAEGAAYKFSAYGGSGGYKFAVANPDVGTIDENGNFTARKKGETTVKVTDSSGNTAQTSNIFVGVSEIQEGECPPNHLPIEIPNPWLPIIICLPLDPGDWE